MRDIYPWLLPLLLKWQALSETHRVSGAMLCSAPQGSGIEKLAEWFVHTLVCSHSTSEPCGFCHSCELAKSGNHPDIHWISPEKEGKSITVDQIRTCNKWALESSQLAGKRVIIITPADAMNESASNALLKTLESPAKNCVFLLLANNNHKLLPTIISRCQKWSIAESNLEETYQWLLTQTSKPCNYVGIRLSNGAPLKALEFFEQKTYIDFQKVESALQTFLSSAAANYNPVWLSIKENPVGRLSWLAIIMSDIQKVHFGCSELGMCEKSTELAGKITYSAAYKAMLSINKMKDQLESFSGLNAELLLINWLIELQEDVCL